MKKIDIRRAWRDGEYFLSLTAEERAQVPTNPAGAVEMSEAELASAAGGTHYSTHGQSWCYNSACTSRVSCAC